MIVPSKAFIITALYCSLLQTVHSQEPVNIKTLPPVTVTATTVRVPKKTWKQFASYFPGAYNNRFYRLDNNWLAKFVLDSQQYRALFTSKGYLIYHISYGYEKNLPADILQLVKSVYHNYEITKAIRVEESKRIIWLINVESENALLLVRIEDGEMEVVQEITKPTSH